MQHDTHDLHDEYIVFINNDRVSFKFQTYKIYHFYLFPKQKKSESCIEIPR